MSMITLLNYAASTLQGSVAPEDTVLHVSDGTPFSGLIVVGGDWAPAALVRPGSNEYEYVRVIGVSDNVITVERGREGTAAKAWAAGDSLGIRLTADAMQTFADEDWRRARTEIGAAVNATQTSVTTCTLPGDFTQLFVPRRACRAVQNTDAYGFVVSSTYAAGVTTVTVKDMVLDAGLEVLDVGLQIAASPEYPNLPVSDAVDSDAQNMVASSRAVKTAYDAINTFIARRDNPNQVTKEQVVLGNVYNYGVASDTEAHLGVANNRYMTPKLSREGVKAMLHVTPTEPATKHPGMLWLIPE